MTVEIPVTAKMRDQLRNQKLNIAGKNYTVTYVLLKEGTPVTTNSKFLSVSSAGMATLVVPFDVLLLPEGVQAYTLTNDGSNVIMATEVNTLEADKPVLIVAPEGEYEFVSEAGASDDISGKTSTYANGALIGTYQTINPLAQTDGAGNNNYILSTDASGNNVAFYQVLDNTCYVEPYRAYLSCSYPGGVAPAPMRIVFRQQTPTDMEVLTAEGQQPTAEKVLLDGKLFIIRNGVMYNVNGQIIQ